MEFDDIQELYGRGRFVAALRAADTAANQEQGLAREQLSLLAGKSALQLGMAEEAIRHLQVAVQSDDPVTHLTAKFELGRALVDFGECSEAERELLGFLSADLTPVPHLRGRALHNLGVAYERRREYALAIETYQQAAADHLLAGRNHDALLSLQDAAWLALAEGLPDAVALVTRAAGLLDGAPDRCRAAQVALEAFAHLQAGQYLEAVESAEEVLQPNHRSATDWERAVAAYVVTRVCLFEGEPRAARAYGDLARQYSPKSGDTRVMKLINQLNQDLQSLAGGE